MTKAEEREWLSLLTQIRVAATAAYGGALDDFGGENGEDDCSLSGDQVGRFLATVDSLYRAQITDMLPYADDGNWLRPHLVEHFGTPHEAATWLWDIGVRAIAS